ncbi:Monoterpene epsilon-lactone hydrolase [Microbacterium lemovicicum]|uniref:Monoterpene epsilon-lactone hydrolase n=1 Tax=Microbacterium lemovicicum TaxID=1072463 RepID=A0A3Q9IYL7_9MICO|nr:alpha/beta hydrolase [Microbacterium lemovicicum]AZS37256.1 Monoterpene epsilon-lactone hydrolase [Microbacterium lemovicicum]
MADDDPTGVTGEDPTGVTGDDKTGMSGDDPTGMVGVRLMLGSRPRPVGWAARRQRIEEVGTTWPVADDIRLEAVDAGGVPAEWSTAPGAAASDVLLFLHGGGYCSGSIVSHRSLATEAGRAAGARTLALQYRLAPEHPFPAALDDALAAWEWLLASGYAPDRIVVGGDSAGGGLALALRQVLRDRGAASPACLWLVSPWTDLTLSGSSMTEKDAADPLLHRPYLDELAAAYLAGGVGRREPLVSPLFADLRGLPPTLVQVGTDEVLLDDAVRLVRAAGAAGAAATLQTWPGMIHAFPLWNGGLPAGREALAEMGRFVRRHLD